MFSLGNIDIVYYILLGLALAATLWGVRKNVVVALGAGGVFLLVGASMLEYLRITNLTLLESASSDALSNELDRYSWAHFDYDVIVHTAQVGFGLLVLAAAVFGIGRLVRWHKQRVHDAELSSQAAQRQAENDLRTLGWPVGQKTGSGQNDSTVPGA